MKQDKKYHYQVSDDNRLWDNELGITGEIRECIGEACECALEPGPADIKKLQGFMDKYPHMPHFKNYLSLAYGKLGEKGKADELAFLVSKEHPDYLFGKINLANYHIERSEFDKVKQILGEELELGDLYPDRDVFHTSEVRAYYFIVARYYFGKKDVEGVELCVEKLRKRVPDAEELGQIAVMVMALRMGSAVERMKKENEKKLKVVVDAAAEKSEKVIAPDFTHPEIAKLYEHDLNIDVDILHQILLLPRESLITDLENVLKDSIARFNYFETSAEDEDLMIDFPIHALYLLGELKSEGSLPMVMEVLSQHEVYYRFYFGDWIHEQMWMPLYKIGGYQLDALKDYMLQPGKYTYAKGVCVTLVEQIVFNQAERKEEVIQWLSDILLVYGNSSVEDNLIDSDLIAFLVIVLAELNGVESAPVIKPLFDNGMVTEGICGSYEDLMKDAGKIRSYRKKEVKSLEESYAEIASWGSYSYPQDDEQKLNDSSYEEEDWSDQPIVKEKKVGRNEPCPCGSGKKYKKCCL